MPIPSTAPAATPLAPPPTMEPRVPVATPRARTLLFVRSAMKSDPVAASYARPRGEESVVAPLATAPSRAPSEPFPAAVLTVPRKVTKRTRLLTVSLIKKPPPVKLGPAAARATPRGP